MTKRLPESVNRKRRGTLTRFTLLALISFQLPISVAYLSIYFGVLRCDYVSVNYAYFSFIATNIAALTMIWLKKQITRPFINLMLYLQVVVVLIIATYVVYVMADLRYFVLVGMLGILIFIFIQSTLFVSVLALTFCVSLYLSTAYVGITFGGQPGSLIVEILYLLVYVPVCCFIAYMSLILQKQQKKIKKANSILKRTHEQLESHNRKTMDSIRYAELIQRSLLPGIERIKAISPDSMFIWMPKDIVGGDIFYTYADPDVSIMTLMDCTGHGVPGAFLTMIVYSEIRKIIMDEACHDPADILKRLNMAVKKALHESNDSNGNDGLDAAVCVIAHQARHVTFAGARIPLFYVKNGDVFKQDGDKQSIGYKHSSDNYSFTNHRIGVEGRCALYLSTDGYTDQLGGERRRRFGTKRFRSLIQEFHHVPFGEQRNIFLQALNEHKNEHEQVDDITILGIRL